MIDSGQEIIISIKDDGLEEIVTKGYFNGSQNSVKHQTRINVPISRANILSELVRCLDLMKTNTPEIVIRIAKDKNGEPMVLQKTWVESREKLK
jgi:hypothetical protein